MVIRLQRQYILLIIAALVLGIGIFIWQCDTSSKHSTPLPIRMNVAKIPSIDVAVEEHSLTMEIDFGSKFEVSLSKEALSKLSTQRAGTLIARDAKGNAYESQAYHIPKLSIGSRVFSDVLVEEIHEDYLRNTTIYTDREILEVLRDGTGVIGRGLLERMSVLLDLKNFVFLEEESLNKLISQGLFPKDYLVIPFETGRTGLILNVNTDIGKLRLSLDTGSTISLVRTSCFEGIILHESQYGLPVFSSQRFIIAGKDFGRSDLYCFDITPELHEIDGILGMNFLEGQIFYIDYPNNMIYIGDLEGNQTIENTVVSNPIMEQEIKNEDDSSCEEKEVASLDREGNNFLFPQNKNYKEAISEEKKMSGSEEEHTVRYSAKNKTNALTYKLETTTKKDRFGKMKGDVKAGVEVTWD